MTADWLFPLTFVAALGSGLIAGLFFAFSAFVMNALSRLPPHQGIASMQSINVAVINPTFMSVFLGTALVSVFLGVAAFFRWREAVATYLLIASILYVAGCFLVTILFNVPLNNALAGAEPESAAGADTWTQYLRSWVRWNHVRTIASIAASGGFTLALLRL
jgi:uncharacterized membrane protein